MVEQYAAHLRFHYGISPKKWREDEYTEEEIIEWYFEYVFIKTELGEITITPNT